MFPVAVSLTFFSNVLHVLRLICNRVSLGFESCKVVTCAAHPVAPYWASLPPPELPRLRPQRAGTWKQTDACHNLHTRTNCCCAEFRSAAKNPSPQF
eukprot:6472349-Amphidinium_carterae.3